jgi:transposase
MNASTLYGTQVVGALPVLTQYLERIKLAEIVNNSVPWDGDVPLGTLVEILVLNRLLDPRAMFRIDDWAQASGVADYYGLKPGELNDDRLGRALERLATSKDSIQAPLVLRVVKVFDLEVSQIHYDLTSVEFFGAYEQAEGEEKPTPLPTYGRAKSGRKHVKQIQAGINVTGDGAVPVAHAALDGNTAESTTHLDNLRRLKEILPKSKLLYICDTKLDTTENLWGVVDAGGEFLCGGAFNADLQRRFLKSHKELRPVTYWPKSQEKRPPAERDQYKAFELQERLYRTVAGKQQKLEYRMMFVWSQAKARQEGKTRERHEGKIRAAFEAIERNLNRYTLKDEKTIVRRCEQAKSKYGEGSMFEYTLTGKPGRFQLRWRQEPKALAEWKQLEGVFVLKTNVATRRLPLADTLAKYREQSKVEKRIGNLKGPLAVAPVFLKNPERIAGLLSIVVWALMVMSLMERSVRRKLKGKPLRGLYPENRPSAAPTGPAILDCFRGLSIVIVTPTHKPTPSRPHIPHP